MSSRSQLAVDVMEGKTRAERQDVIYDVRKDVLEQEQKLKGLKLLRDLAYMTGQYEELYLDPPHRTPESQEDFTIKICQAIMVASHEVTTVKTILQELQECDARMSSTE